jgi:benzoyl-CoA reductase/2-hydroxyglutaryl-CoA dehydratase subunit BcrC/BadD/HgdB
MSSRCCKDSAVVDGVNPCAPPEHRAGTTTDPARQIEALSWFSRMIPNCLSYARQEKAQGRKVAGIMCEYCPRELVLAAGAVPVVLCGGSADTILSAEEQLPANLCPLIKSTYGYLVQHSNPFLEMADLVVGETTCDGKKKMFELLGESRPMCVLEFPQKETDQDALELWVREMHKFRATLASRFDVEITDEQIREAIRLMNRERSLRRELASLMKADAPPLTGRELLTLKSSISCIPADLEQYEKAVAALQQRPVDPGASSRVRVLMTGVPMPSGAERVMEIVEDHGGLVVCLETCMGVKPILEDVDPSAPDIIRALAEKYFRIPCSVKTPNDARLRSLAQLAREYRAECIVEVIWQACLTYDVETYRVKKLAEQELDIPYLRIETDYSPSDTARIAVRVEALFETVRSSCA